MGKTLPPKPFVLECARPMSKKRNLRPGEYRTAWEALKSQVEGAMERIAELNPEAVVLEVDGDIFCYLHGATHLSREALLEILKTAHRAVPRPKKEVALWALWESADPPRWERLAGACRTGPKEPPPGERDGRLAPLEA